MDSRWARVARGLAAAAFATFVAAFSHVVAGGSAPGIFGIAASLVISSMLCTVLTARALSLWRLTASVALSQLLFHALFSGLGAPVAATHHMDSMVMDAAATHSHPDAVMWLAHTAAGVVTVITFRYAEAAFWGLADTARLLLARLLAIVVPAPAAPASPTVAVERRFVPRDLALLLSSMRHRGPPVGFAAS